MAYDEHLAERIQAHLADTPGVAELKMFGGWCATIAGNMAIGVLGDDLIVRVGPAGYEDALARSGVREFDFSGRPMAGWVYVEGATVRTSEALAEWIERGVGFARSLPAKAPGGRGRARPAGGG
jgi:hypothetical protein